MTNFFNSTAARTESGDAFRILSSIRDSYVVLGCTAIALTAAILSSFENGYRFLQRVFWLFDSIFGGADHNVSLPGPAGLPIFGNLLQLKNGPTRKIAQWTRKYGAVFRVSLGEREAVFINTHRALAQTIVQQGPAYQSRPIFKLFHSDYASSGIWTLGTSPFSERLVRTRKSLSSQVAPRLLPTYVPVIHPKLQKLLSEVLEISQGPAIDMAERLHCFGTGQVSEQLMGQALDEKLVSVLAENETNIFRQRSIGSPMSDYVPALRAAGYIRFLVSKFFGIKGWAYNEKERNAHSFRSLQQNYIHDLLDKLRTRLDSGDTTPSILGNILRQDHLKEEEILLASYTGIAAGVNIGYSLIWVIGYLANRPDLQQSGFAAIQEVYSGEAPHPHEFDRVAFVKALHMEGSRIFTPVRLGFPRQTLDGANYNGHHIPRDTLVVMNLFAANRDPNAFDRPDEFLPERWLDGRNGQTGTPSVDGNDVKIGVPHLTYGAGRRSCPGSYMANRCIYSTLVLLLHFFTWERQPLSEEQKKYVFPHFRAGRECTLEMDAIGDNATPTEVQAIPWSAGIKFHCRDPEALRQWLSNNSAVY